MKKLFIILVGLLVTASVYSQTYNVNTFYAELGGYVIQTDGTHGVVVAINKNQRVTIYWSMFTKKMAISDNSKYTSDGAKFNDWRIPTIDELKIIYKQRRNIGGLYNGMYWSTMECNMGMLVWVFNKNESYCYRTIPQPAGIGDNSPFVRAVRAF